MSTFEKCIILVAFIAAGVVFVLTHPRVLGRFAPGEGVALRDGVRVVLQANPDDLKDANGQPLSPEQRTEKMDAAVRIISNRLAGYFARANPRVSRQGDDRILVELPRTKDTQKALNRIKSNAKLEIYYLKDVESERNPFATWRMQQPQPDERTGADVYTFENVATKQIIKSDTPEGMQKILDEVIDAWDRKTNPDGQKPIISGDDLKPNAKGDLQGSSQVVIAIELNERGTEKFEGFTRQHIGELTAIVLGNRILTAPRIVTPIIDGKAIITGFASLEEAQEIAELLNSGSLPVELEVGCIPK